ncbi:hypothetical protein [Streptomyces montanisoli]|uniref:Uncharacterized protein n=1 Tax=Streptomyces montanisoli TaxID=2798581 RepID=A0A940MEK1_9ACTN|nr:hypothetical protein [Streptomyces montanisoli]MBP0458157.1 hypothetical protein [Streptomyces montanisoli]
MGRSSHLADHGAAWERWAARSSQAPSCSAQRCGGERKPHLLAALPQVL